MLYFSPFCLNLVYVNVYVPKLGGGVVPKSDVYNYSDPMTQMQLISSNISYTIASDLREFYDYMGFVLPKAH